MSVSATVGCRSFDLSPSGRQPVVNETGDVIVVFNGEVFNYVELRGELIGGGHVFRSRTDTEVIVHAYDEWGPDCVTRCNGMWALALWDQQEERGQALQSSSE